MQQITVHTPSASYPVLCGRGALAQAGSIVTRLARSGRIFFLSSPRVWRYWGRWLGRCFGPFGGGGKILFDDREAAKNLWTVEKICRALVRAQADRRALVVALGGGVVGDVAGFVAASYLRGVGLVHVPTTLVAQVDSAIGGKTGVNLREGKNLVGAFYQPLAVIADPDLLRTLPERQYRSGLYEVIKYGVIGDEPLFRFLESRLAALLARDRVALGWTLVRCVRAKAAVVSRDERESGLRQILNFGHTVGHALEAATHYRRFLHGEAVGWGMIAATLLAVASDRLGVHDAARIVQMVARVGPLPELPRISSDRFHGWMHADKKTRGGKLRFVLPTCIGRVELAGDIPERTVLRVLDELPGVAKMWVAGANAPAHGSRFAPGR